MRGATNRTHSSVRLACARLTCCAVNRLRQSPPSHLPVGAKQWSPYSDDKSVDQLELAHHPLHSWYTQRVADGPDREPLHFQHLRVRLRKGPGSTRYTEDSCNGYRMQPSSKGGGDASMQPSSLIRRLGLQILRTSDFAVTQCSLGGHERCERCRGCDGCSGCRGSGTSSTTEGGGCSG